MSRAVSTTAEADPRPNAAPRPRKRRSKRLSTPAEHGGIASLGGMAILAAMVAPSPLVAIAAMIVYAVAYMARGPIERRVRGGRPRAWDERALLVYAALAAAATAIVALHHPIGAGAVAVTAGAMPVVGAIVRRRKLHRHLATETLALAACSGAAGVAVFAAGGAELLALTVAVAAGTHGAAATPIVRAELRKGLSEAGRARLAGLGLGLLAIGAGLTALLAPLASAALAPRAAHAGYRIVWPGRTQRRNRLIVRECLLLGAFVALLATALA